MKLHRLLLLIAVFSISESSIASVICGFDFQKKYREFVLEEEGCAVRIVGATNYVRLNYLTFLDFIGIDDLLKDDTFFLVRNGEKYFVSEEVDDPRTTIKILRQEPAKSVRFGGLSGYEERVDYFIQTLPDFGVENRVTYSGKVSCMIMAVGDKNRSFKTRFCTQKTIAGIKRL